MPLILPFGEHRPEIAADAFIAANATLIGDLVVGARSGIWFGCVLRADINPIRIGSDVNLQDGTIVHVSQRGSGTQIGDRVSVGHMAVIHACLLEPDSFVGMNGIVMDDAIVESGAMLAAGALLGPGKRIPRGELWAGRPARKLRDLTAADYETFESTTERYIELGRRYRGSGANPV